jgi:16S rRNA (guanine527-N7)-methyltransferase
MSSAEQLARGLAALGVDLPAPTQVKLLAFAALLGKWNKVYNLTALRGETQVISHHLLDSLAVLPHLGAAKRLADIGSGGGLPGIPLAIARPDCAFTLLDANAKKTRFVTQAVGELALKNVDVVQARVENYRPVEKFDTLVTRAFSSIADMLNNAQHLCAPGGRFLAMKGVYPEEELAAIPAAYAVSEVVALKVPGLDAARHLAIITLRS